MKSKNMTTLPRSRGLALAVAACAVLSGCAAPSNPQDPFEKFNRASFAFNDTVDRVALKPAATVYKNVTPGFVQTGVGNFFGNLSDKAQLQFLESTVDELPTLDKQMASMVDEWARGDPEALAREMNDELKSSPEVARVLLVDRNRNWAQWIKQRMTKPGTVFIAVGAGHLAGPDSVQAQLAKLGLKAERVRY